MAGKKRSRIAFFQSFDRLFEQKLLEGLVVLDAEGLLETAVRIVLEVSLDKLKGREGCFQYFFREAGRSFKEGFVPDYLAYKTDAERLFGVDAPSRKAKVAGHAVADEPAQRREQGRNAELDLRVAEDGGGTADADVADGGEVETPRPRPHR